MLESVPQAGKTVVVAAPAWAVRPTADGSLTFYSQRFGEAFHAREGAWQEAWEKFVWPCRLKERARARSRLRLLDVCYGLGHNTAAALSAIWQAHPDCQVEWVGLELEPAVARQATATGAITAPTPVPELLAALARDHQLQTPHFRGQLRPGDARRRLPSNWQADAILLDPFSPPRCPSLWTVEFLSALARCLAPDGWLATYSRAAAIRSALQQAGLYVGATPGRDRRSVGTLANWRGCQLPALPPQEWEHLQTRAAVPYRDPQLQDTDESIRWRRRQAQQASPLETTSQWKKRWQRATR